MTTILFFNPEFHGKIKNMLSMDVDYAFFALFSFVNKYV